MDNESFGKNQSFMKRLTNGHPMTEGVRWTEKYADRIEHVFSKTPKFVTSLLATLAVFVFGTSIQGEWILILVHFLKQMTHIERNSSENINHTLENIFDDHKTMEQKFVFDQWIYFVTWAAFGSYFIYFAVGGFLHWYFYVRQRSTPHEWKCQPDKFLSAELEKHEIIVGSISLFCVSILTGSFACYIYNGGSLQWVYYSPSEYGWWWFFLQVPVIFIYQDYATYLTHRFYHIPFFYKHFHKLHHTYKQPTAFSVTAIHPVEIVQVQLTMAVPLFVMPVHWLMFYTVVLYTYYHAILDHSGITFKAQWWQPWQPDAIFHDNHHQYTHVNFGFNIYLWDVLHDTYRRKDRVYNEDIFYGKGLALDEVPKNVLLNDIAERKSENPLAYPDNVNVNELSLNDISVKSKQKLIKKETNKKK
ncbi:lathosterol oxidase-like [Bradysia coprophila]|uniref:lathosterol oxidase-like n=1 Tax=Bradysia coprophila TaxID=38358 RepID=UPI00187DCBA3|nr:lathosterol oxidase-like [Bradysia coprophila]